MIKEYFELVISVPDKTSDISGDLLIGKHFLLITEIGKLFSVTVVVFVDTGWMISDVDSGSLVIALVIDDTDSLPADVGEEIPEHPST